MRGEWIELAVMILCVAFLLAAACAIVWWLFWHAVGARA